MTFFFTFIFMILVFWRPQEWLVPQLFGIPLLNGVVGLAVLALLLEISSNRIHFPKRLQQPMMLLGLWFACVFSHVPDTYFQGVLDSWEEPAKVCFFTYLLFVVLDSPKKLRAVAWLFVLMALVMSFHGLMQHRLGYGFAYRRPLRIWKVDGTIQLRSLFFGIFEDPNDMGQMIIACMPFAFLLFRRNNFLTVLIGAGLCWYLYMGYDSTGSRGAMIGLVALAGMEIVMRLPVRWMPILIGTGLVGALVVSPFYTRVLDMSARERIVFWGLGNQAFISSPLKVMFGLGYGMFWTVTQQGRAAHNAFVNCYVELGLFGYTFWFGMIILGIVGAWRVRQALDRRSDDPEERYLWRFCGHAIAAIIAYCASSYFLSRTFIYPFFFLIALVGVLPVVAQRLKLADDDALDVYTSDHDAAILSVLGACFSVVYIYISIRLMNLGMGM